MSKWKAELGENKCKWSKWFLGNTKYFCTAEQLWTCLSVSHSLNMKLSSLRPGEDAGPRELQTSKVHQRENLSDQICESICCLKHLHWMFPWSRSCISLQQCMFTLLMFWQILCAEIRVMHVTDWMWRRYYLSWKCLGFCPAAISGLDKGKLEQVSWWTDNRTRLIRDKVS